MRKVQQFDRISIIFGDAAAKQDRLEMRQHGMRVQASVKGDDSIRLGVDVIKGKLEVNEILARPKFFVIKSACPNTIREFNEWANEVGDDGRPILDEYVDANNHCMDALRYIVYSQPRTGAHYRAVTLRGI
jgi:hypothetical protein